MVIIVTVHDASVKLPKYDEWVENLDGSCRPDGMSTVGEEDRPEKGRSPNREDDHTLDIAGGRNLFPGCDQFSDRGTDENTFV